MSKERTLACAECLLIFKTKTKWRRKCYKCQPPKKTQKKISKTKTVPNVERDVSKEYVKQERKALSFGTFSKNTLGDVYDFSKVVINNQNTIKPNTHPHTPLGVGALDIASFKEEKDEN